VVRVTQTGGTGQNQMIFPASQQNPARSQVVTFLGQVHPKRSLGVQPVSQPRRELRINMLDDDHRGGKILRQAR